jgi:hypothetical protein
MLEVIRFILLLHIVFYAVEIEKPESVVQAAEAEDVI